MNENLSYNLATLLSSLSQKISSCELAKSLLRDEINFSAVQLFKHLDNLNCQFLNTSDFLKFFQDEQVSISRKEAKRLVKWWDRDGDGKISLSDFISNVHPLKLQNPLSPLTSPKFPINYTVKYKFIRLIHRELLLINDLYQNRSQLYLTIGYSTEACFRLLTKNAGFKFSDLEGLLSGTKLSYTPSDLQLLFFKFDRQNLGLISYIEFKDIIGQSEPASFNQSKTSQKLKKTYYKKLLKNAIALLSKIGNFEVQIENIKKKLLLEWDFAYIKIFQFFDRNSRGFLTTSDFEKTLNYLGLFPSRKELYFVFQKFDRDCDGKLDYSEFCQMIKPVDPSYHSFSSGNDHPTDTKVPINHLIALFKSLITSESSIEKSRKAFSQVDLFEIFKLISSDSSDFITFSDIKAQDIQITDKETSFIFQRFSENKQEKKMSLAEFISELSPKT